MQLQLAVVGFLLASAEIAIVGHLGHIRLLICFVNDNGQNQIFYVSYCTIPN